MHGVSESCPLAKGRVYYHSNFDYIISYKKLTKFLWLKLLHGFSRKYGIYRLVLMLEIGTRNMIFSYYPAV